MASLFNITALFAALLVSHALATRQIRTEVYCSKTDEDFGSFVELQTTITESGNGENDTNQFNISLPESSTFAGLGSLIANATFSGTNLPGTMSVRVIEDDEGSDDGVCKLDITAAFSNTPTYVTCTREATDGLNATYIITAKVFEV